MKHSITIILLLISSTLVADEELPVWVFPILGSKFIGDNCSIETNQLMMKISFSPDGVIEDLVFIKESSIPEITEEAKKYMLEESPFGEFVDMSAEEKKKYSMVIMSYTIPCQTHHKKSKSK